MTVTVLLAEIRGLLRPMGQRVPRSTTAEGWAQMALQFAALARAAEHAEASCHRGVAVAELGDLRAIAVDLGIRDTHRYTATGLKVAIDQEITLRQIEGASDDR
jgi:hypothetical protein